ncbi:GtrA family protein [Marinobacter fonticola]|uniref:GtrA family protein n=1 Tax=Marinobacter fonticola TaxID=2603215 RepID=UPI00143CFA70|nr:GtrA family protein [Marinobacter fonticola]
MQTGLMTDGRRGWRWLRFLLTGGLSTAIHWTVMAAAIAIGQAALTASIIGSVAGALTNYQLQRNITFNHRGAHRPALVRYLLCYAFGGIVNAAFFWLLHGPLELSTVPAQTLTTAVITGLNYVLYARIVFHD